MLRDVPKRTRVGRREVMAGMATVAAIGGGLAFFGSRAEAKVYETTIGERRRVVLEDNSVAMLDTDTRIAVKYDETSRLVDLQRGQVNFHVSADRGRPFTVSGAQQNIVSHQSDFEVRRDGQTISVVLINGYATVESRGHETMLQSGERLIASDSRIRLDKPRLQPLLAWQKGQAILENDKLADAIGEMNRYSTMKLTIGDPVAAELRVSGVYKVGDNLGFAHSIARLLPLRVMQSDGKVILLIDTERARQG
jgi:transmembrane sensor